MKKCAECGHIGHESEFKRSKNKGSTSCWRCRARDRHQKYVKKKEDAIRHLGGKCVDCGEELPYPVFEFHHRDPSEKNYDWNSMRKKSMSKVLEEPSKCDLLCANCHRIRHHNEEMSKTNRLERTTSVSWADLREVTDNRCSDCGKPTRLKKSTRCADCNAPLGKGQKIVWPALEELIDRLRAGSFLSVSKELGVTDNTIRKHLRKRGVDHRTLRRHT